MRSPTRAGPSPGHLTLPRATRWLSWMAALALGGSCTKTTTPPPVAPSDPAADLPPLGDTSAAYAGHEGGTAEPEARVRPAPAVVEDRDAALEAVRHGNPEGAATFLREFVAAHPDDRDARVALARALVQTGALADAGTTLADPQGTPTDPQVLRRRAQIEWRLGRADAAGRLLDEGRRAHPNDLPLRGESLWLQVRRGRGDSPEAKALMDGLYDAYDAGEAKTAEDLLAVAQAALARGTGGAFHDANMVLQDAENLAPVTEGRWVADDVLLLRGSLFLEKYAEAEAAETFAFVLERDSWHADALVGMARVHMHGLRFAEAARLANEALQVAPHHPDAHAVLGRIALIEGRRDETRQRGEQESLATNPHHTAALAMLAGLAIAEDDPAAYAKWRDEALTLDARGRDFFTDLADILGFLHLYPESDRILHEAVALAPEDPYVLGALGLNQLRLGHEQQGRESLASAWKRDHFNERTQNVLRLYEDTIDPHYAERVVGDLTVRLPKQDREFIEPGLLDSVTRSRDELDGHYGMKAGALRLEFYAEPEAFSVRTVGVPSLGALAVCFGPVITFVGPYRGAYNIDMVVRHELGHTYAIALSGGRVPRWFTEGLSEWESELADPAWARESAELLSRAKRAGKLRRLSELELAFIRAENSMMMEVAYATAAYAIRYLGRTYGRETLIEVLRGYRTGADTDTLFRKHMGKELAVVEKDFERWFFAELDAKVSGWHPSPQGEGDERDALLVSAVEQAGSGQPQDATRTLQELISEGGDGYAPRMMLAKLLLEGPNPTAAVRHLEAARGHHGEAIEPLVLLANLARDQGQVIEEKAHLTAALAIDGDSLEPAARLLMLAVVTNDAPALAIAKARVQGIAPLHPMSLAARALEMAPRKADRAAAGKHLRRALRDLEPGRGPSDTFVVGALAAAALGQTDDAKALAKAARADPKLPKVATERLRSIGE